MVPACSLNSLGDEAGESLQSSNSTQAFVIKQDALSPPKKFVEKSPHLYVIGMNLEVSESWKCPVKEPQVETAPNGLVRKGLSPSIKTQ